MNRRMYMQVCICKNAFKNLNSKSYSTVSYCFLHWFFFSIFMFTSKLLMIHAENRRKTMWIRYVRHQLLSIRIWQEISKASLAMKYVVRQIAQNWNMKHQSIYRKKITVNNNFISHMTTYFSDKKKKGGIKRDFSMDFEI